MSGPEKKPQPLIYRFIKTPAKDLGLTSAQKFVLLSYIDALNPKVNGTLAWPGRECIAAQTGYDEKTVRRAIDVLCEKDYIKLHHRTARKKVFAVNVGVISRLLVESGHSVQSPDDEWTLCPERVDIESEMSGHSAHRTANRTANGNSNDPSFGCSANPRDGSDPVQRQMMLAGVVAGAAQKMRVNRDEPPKEEKPEERKTANGGKR